MTISVSVLNETTRKKERPTAPFFIALFDLFVFLYVLFLFKEFRVNYLTYNVLCYFKYELDNKCYDIVVQIKPPPSISS